MEGTMNVLGLVFFGFYDHRKISLESQMHFESIKQDEIVIYSFHCPIHVGAPMVSPGCSVIPMARNSILR